MAMRVPANASPSFAYCLHVYFKNLWSDDPTQTTGSNSALPTYSGSLRTQTARAIYRRLKRVLWLQWRGIAIVTIMLSDVIFFAVVFLYLDDTATSLTKNYDRVEPWLLCLVISSGDKEKCLSLGSRWLLSEGTVVGVLLMFSLGGIQAFLLLFRASMITGWKDFFVARFSPHKQEFVSLDAISTHRGAGEPSPAGFTPSRMGGGKKYAGGATFEMQQPRGGYGLDVDAKVISPTVTDVGVGSPQSYTSAPQEPQDAYHSPLHFGGAPEADAYFPPGQSPERRYAPAMQSFSGPRVPERENSTRSVNVNRDPTSTYARGGLGAHPRGRE